jgi:hypothetical protein
VISVSLQASVGVSPDISREICRRNPARCHRFEVRSYLLGEAARAARHADEIDHHSERWTMTKLAHTAAGGKCNG